MIRVLSFAASLAVLAIAAPAAAETVKQMFERYGLIGTFALDCSRPADGGNFYFVNRVLDDNTVQRDRMSGPSTRDFIALLDRAEELQPNEIRVGGNQDGSPVEGIWRIGPEGMAVWQATQNKSTVVQDGKIVGTNNKFPFLNRCVARAAAAPAPAVRPAAETVKQVLERYRMVGTFAYDCEQPAGGDNMYFVNRLVDDNNAQFDQMNGPTGRAAAILVTATEAIGPAKVRIKGTMDDAPVDIVWEIAKEGIRLFEFRFKGEVRMRDGKHPRTGNEVDFLNRCKTP